VTITSLTVAADAFAGSLDVGQGAASRKPIRPVR